MKILSIDITSYSTGKMLISLDMGHIGLNLTEEEKERFIQLGNEIFTSRQKAIAHEIKTAGPMLLTVGRPASVGPYDDEIPL